MQDRKMRMVVLKIKIFGKVYIGLKMDWPMRLKQPRKFTLNIAHCT